MKTPLQQFAALVVLVGILVAGSLYYSNKRPEAAKVKSIATISTTKGDIKVELFERDAPKTVDNFKQLAQKDYYKDVIFHRVMKDFMIQTGDPTGTGTGGESAFGRDFGDEINPKSLGLDANTIREYQAEGYRYNYALTSHKVDVGAVAMANRGPNTNGSQFFIVTEQAWPHLDGRHTVFGKVVEGMDVVKAIAAVSVDGNDKPTEDVKITGVKVEEQQTETAQQ